MHWPLGSGPITEIAPATIGHAAGLLCCTFSPGTVSSELWYLAEIALCYRFAHSWSCWIA